MFFFRSSPLYASQEAALYQSISFYRVVCFGKPRGPWRLSREQAQRDAVSEGLGSFDEWGAFYATVPGDIEVTTMSASIVRAAHDMVSGQRSAA
jgi:hypothetical protein